MDVNARSLSNQVDSKVYQSRFESALSILLKLEKKSEVPSDLFVAEWVHNLESALSKSHRMSLIEHTALQSIRLNWRQQSLALYRITTAQVESLLTISHYNLTHTPPSQKLTSASVLTQRLPNSLLRGHPRDERLIHQALFIKKGPYKFTDSVRQLWTDYYFEKQDLMWPVALIIPFLIGPWSSSLFCGLIAGFLFCSFTEYIIHRHVAHSSAWERKFLKRLGKIGQDFSIAHLEHSIHHGSVNKNYILPFDDCTLLKPEQRTLAYKKRKEKVDQFVLTNYGKTVLINLKNGNYGTTNPNVRRTQLAFLPVTLLFAALATFVSVLAGVTFPFLFFVGFAMTSQMWIATSCYYHPLFHRRVSELQRLYPKWTMFLFTSRLSRYIARAHKAHHSTGGLKNQNINLGFDILFGWAPVSISDVAELRKSEALY